jgi:hypothetical protein
MIVFIERLLSNTRVLALIAAIKKLFNIMNFERHLSRRSKIILTILLLAMWISSPMAIKLMFVSTHCVNFGIGLLIHGCILYRKTAPYKGINLNFGRPATVLIGAAFVFSGVALRGGMHWR